MRILKLILLVALGYGLYEALKRYESVDALLADLGLGKPKPDAGRTDAGSTTTGGAIDHSGRRAEPFGTPHAPITGSHAGGGTGVSVVTADDSGMSTTERVGRGVVRRD